MSGAGESTAESAVAAWFIDQYHLDFLGEVLNAGGTSVPEWEPHLGQRQQAQVHAEMILGVLRALPVDQRMEALGMRRIDCGWTGSERVVYPQAEAVWVES